MKTITIKIIAVMASLIALGMALLYGLLYASLPQLDGELTMPGATLSAPTRLERDALGSAIITANNRSDAAFALGFAHGQDRFFQMDLLRRNAAGELAELFGDGALALDKSHRFHQFRQRARLAVSQLPSIQAHILNAYSAGVNAALSQQTINSFEYWLSSNTLAPWQPEDSLLVIYSMYLDLQSATLEREQVLEYIKRSLGDDMVAFISQNDRYQAALDGSELTIDTMAVPALPVALTPYAQSASLHIGDADVVGSNNWAVTGSLTASGHAMLSDDMHLGLAVPVIWYRAQLNYRDAQQQGVQVTGVSLPGAPAIVVGTNNQVAWGFTNAYIDTADWVALAPTDKTQTLTEVIYSKDQPHELAIEMSRYGPVTQVDGVKYALAWVGHQSYAVDMDLIELETASDVDSALALSAETGIPVQNMLVTDSQGNAAWRLTGAISSRDNPNITSQQPQQFQAHAWLSPATDIPVVKNPQQHRLWSANSRVLSTQDHLRFGDGGYAIGSRSSQIKDNLMAHQQFDETEFLTMQLDNRAIFMRRWHSLLTASLATDINQYHQDLDWLRNWGECACSDSVGYSLVTAFRNQLLDDTFAPLEHHLANQDLSLRRVKSGLETAFWQLLSRDNSQWLPQIPTERTAFILASYQQAKAKLLKQHSPSGQLQDLAWGRVNALTISHPFSRQIPGLAPVLDMPSVAGFGGRFEPAVQAPRFGASQRFIVQPGREQDGILTLPGGQSGHPLSAYYRAGFDDYANHQATPLLPTAPRHTLHLKPEVNP
ncbi:penicillin acylase family protein [Shewanella sp. NIFS-20-20]|uniref:penicillin acylase family protein n=1 Tax=Shewanella sp. NIFS-20-20 TaxID=2853806 RepID=UPI001C47F87A|nr:penicillin acylase family protein [Shewanella sp. NIFS-20-20]MBV7316569.1 penicillin acylase family protein [Shewanella sp. NIFS-20-20]